MNESESEHVSNTKEQEGSFKNLNEEEKEEEKVNEEEKEEEEEKETETVASNADSNFERVRQRKPTNFPRIYTFHDEKKILKALAETGHTTGCKQFWQMVCHTLKLSIPVCHSQLYEKIRRLKAGYLSDHKKQSAPNPPPMTPQMRRLYRLSHKIWKKDACQVQVQVQEEADDNDKKLAKFLREFNNHNNNNIMFPIAEALELIVPASKRSKLEKKWNHLDAQMLKLHMARTDLIQKITGSVASSPSFQSFILN